MKTALCVISCIYIDATYQHLCTALSHSLSSTSCIRLVRSRQTKTSVDQSRQAPHHLDINRHLGLTISLIDHFRRKHLQSNGSR